MTESCQILPIFVSVIPFPTAGVLLNISLFIDTPEQQKKEEEEEEEEEDNDEEEAKNNPQN